MNRIFTEQLEKLNDLCKVIYDCSSSGEINCIKTYKVSQNQFIYFRLFIISEFFEHQGAPVINYVISDLEPKDFLFWNLLKNEIEVAATGKILGNNEVAFLLAKVKFVPGFMKNLLEELKNNKRR